MATVQDLKSLDTVFTKKVFRIPDYQRGYAWQREQLKAFWEDLLNLPLERNHYTGVLTLRQVNRGTVRNDAPERWLLDDHSYRMYDVVDGQQRLTTFVILIQSFVEAFEGLPGNEGKKTQDIHVTDSLTLANLQHDYLFETKPNSLFPTYRFGYSDDNPSQRYLRHAIFRESNVGTLEETFYTLNLSNAKRYFTAQLRSLYAERGAPGLAAEYRKLTQRLLFNEYDISNDFDVFVAFETMNNRGKTLSDLELLKNRLIYLTTLYLDDALNEADRSALRERVNQAWQEVYHQLGRDKARPLNDDDFLRAHWISYFKYSRRTGRDYARFLLKQHFTPRRIQTRLEHQVVLEEAEEQQVESLIDESEDVDGGSAEPDDVVSPGQLTPEEIRDFVGSLKSSAVHWFKTFNPRIATATAAEEQIWIERLNRLGMGYFRPLIMVISKTVPELADRVRVLREIERFVFIAFRLTTARTNYGSSVFYKVARDLNLGEIGVDHVIQKLNEYLSYAFRPDGSLSIDGLRSILERHFKAGNGFYAWSGLRYVLYEYEYEREKASRQAKVLWDDLLKHPRDRISIEHIYPQTPTEEWVVSFKDLSPEGRLRYCGSLGNLLLLSASINSSLQNVSFADKKLPRLDAAGNIIRNGYSEGSHSEMEVSRSVTWGPNEVRERGLRLVRFIERRWNLSLRDDKERESLLFLD
jgi:uncharacterized protein DUF262/uncharacterized protein DUF1524